MGEMEDMTTLSLCIGIPDEHSKSRGTRCKPKPPIRPHGSFPHQLQEETDHEIHENRDAQARKKLRLTREQLTILDNVYQDQSNLDLARKKELAKNLDLNPRQVEVWFQNRRARSKQKKTAVDYENLKRTAKLLIEENRKLKRELEEQSICSSCSSANNKSQETL